MDHILTLVAVFGIFIPALMLPGPDFVGVVRSATAHGLSAGLMTALGVSVMLMIYATLSLVGLAAVMTDFEWLAWTVRVLGGLYLAYLGVRLLMTARASLDIEDAPSPSANRSFVFGLLVTLTNPKAIVLFASVFATAVTPATPGWLMVTMVGLVGLSSLVWYALVSAFLAAPPVLARIKRSAHWVERAAGVCFIGLGGKIIADARNPVTP